MRRWWLFLALLACPAGPAAAGEQRVAGAPVDAVALLMDDQRILAGGGIALPSATMLALLLEDRRALAGSALPRLSDTPTLARFEAVTLPPPQMLVLTVPMSGWRVPPTPPRQPLTAQEIVSRSMPALGPRRPSVLSATVILRVDDKEETPLFAMGGAAAILNPLMR